MPSEFGRAMALSALLGLVLAGCGSGADQPTTASPATAPTTAAPAPTSTSAPAASAPATSEPATTGSPAAPGARRYTVRQTRPAGAQGGAGAVLVLAKDSKAEARAAIGDYLRRTPPKGYLSVEALGRAGGAEWICMGERVTSEDDMQYAIFEGTQALATFPGEWIECRD